MSTEIICTLLSLVGTLVGTLSGIMASTRLTSYRLAQLEDKVNKHNNLIERTYKIEEEIAIQKEKIAVANHRIDDLEQEAKHDS